MIKNAYIEDSIIVTRPTGGSDLTQDRPWGVNAHVRIEEGWLD